MVGRNVIKIGVSDLFVCTFLCKYKTTFTQECHSCSMNSILSENYHTLTACLGETCFSLVLW